MDYCDPDLISAIDLARRRQSDGNQPAAAAAMALPAPAQASYSLHAQLLATAIGTVSPGEPEPGRRTQLSIRTSPGSKL